MIKSSDLRINNLVFLTQDGFKTKKVYQLSGFDIYKVDESDCYDIDGIPLSKEILAKFGYTGTENSGFRLNEYFELHYITTEDNFQTEVKMPYSEWLLVDIKFVHQLQNFYFALTGKELFVSLSQDEWCNVLVS